MLAPRIPRAFSASRNSARIPATRASAMASMPMPMPLRPIEEGVDVADDKVTGIDMTFEPIYRVILHYTNWNDHRIIGKAVKQAVPVITYTHALRSAENAAAHGSAIVVTVPKDDAEMYESRLSRAGLKASLDLA